LIWGAFLKVIEGAVKMLDDRRFFEELPDQCPPFFE
jgi:hypothetical protein